MIDKLWLLIPEMILFLGVIAVSIMGLSPLKNLRDLVPFVVMGFLAVAMLAVPLVYTPDRVANADLLMPNLGHYIKMMVCGVGILLAMLKVGLIDRRFEKLVGAGRAAFDPMRVNRGEFFVFFLLSLIGVMLVANANDLIWLFLALELSSLPTYVMVAMSRQGPKAQEAAVKYFFLGAMATAVFLYGFALMYGSTGTIILTEMRTAFAEQAASGGINYLGIVGMIIALLGVSFKIAAFPMHFYVADVYEGAASAVTAFIAFVPKTAGMLAIILMLATVGWTGHGEVAGLPQPILYTLWVVAVFTMTLGNIGALLQRSVKRMLAYSSIAHSGYMLIGIIAGPGIGINSVLFYLTAYGIMNTGAFAVLAGLERRGAEIESLEEITGLRERFPWMAFSMALASGSLLGIPPLLGFVGKLYLFIGGIEAGQIALIVIAALNTAISAWYYLALVGLPILKQPTAQAESVQPHPSMWPRLAAVITAFGVIVVAIFSSWIMTASEHATSDYERPQQVAELLDSE
jgi:NADH-quinone oxidoreductase subunit N